VEYLEIEAARRRSDLRLVLTAGVPGPWGEAAKGLFHVKRIPYTAVAQEGGGKNAALRDWTGHDNAPIVVYGDEPVRTIWTEIIFFSERLAPEPALIPADAADRASMFGLCHEISGENGLGWSRRLMMLHDVLENPVLADSPAGDSVRRLGRKYGYGSEAAAAAPARAIEVLALLASRLRDQRRRSSRFFVSDTLSALDVYWAAFAALVSPLPDASCPMPAFLRTQYDVQHPGVRQAVDPILLEHRDFIYREFLRLPLVF
jgi:glutathione S-transferase